MKRKYLLHDIQIGKFDDQLAAIATAVTGRQQVLDDREAMAPYKVTALKGLRYEVSRTSPVLHSDRGDRGNIVTLDADGNAHCDCVAYQIAKNRPRIFPPQCRHIRAVFDQLEADERREDDAAT